MADGKTCPSCGAPLAADALTGGDCPGCLRRQALEEIGFGDTTAVVDEPAAPQPDPEAIGPYRIVRRLGEGGMGVVFLAEQTDPIRRQVAVKVVRAGIGSESFLSRFQLEREALARMDHPNIARIFDAGSTDTGQPYFVMEYVDGETVTEYCDRRRMTIEDRVGLFRRVCGAIQHAHRRGVIHRDLKPTNLLVHDGADGPEPKVIDFGIAKATGDHLFDASVRTAMGHLVGTPSYMSPEQAEIGETDVDTRTDVFSLGVVLYELLAGVTPHDADALARASLGAMLTTVRDASFPPPSVRFQGLGEASVGVAERRGTSPAALANTLRGELDWIVMRALERDRAMRYGGAAELQQDLDRYLQDEPVVARAPTTMYRIRKFVQRNRTTVTIAAVFALGLLGAVAGVVTGLVRARIAEREAREQAAIAEATNRFLNEDLLSAVAPEKQGPDVKLREVLDAASGLIDERFPDEPLIRAAIHRTVGEAYSRLGRNEDAYGHFERALEIRREILGDRHVDTADSLNDFGAATAVRGDMRAGSDLLAEALAILRETAGPDDERTLTCQRQLASILVWQGRFDEAEPLFADALERARRALGPDHLETVTVLNDYGLMFSRQRRPAEAIPYLDEAYEGYVRIRGQRSADALVVANNLATCYFSLGNYEQAVSRFEALLEDTAAVFGDTHPKTYSVMNNLAIVYRRNGRNADSIPLLETIVAARTEAHGPVHRDTLTSLHNLGRAYLSAGRTEDARRTLERTVRGRTEVYGDDHPKTLSSKSALASCYGRSGSVDRALALDAEILAHRAVLEDQDRRVLGLVLSRHGSHLTAVERYDEAEAAFLEAEEVFGTVPNVVPSDVESNRRALIELLERRGRPEDAAAWKAKLAAAS